MSHKPTMVYGKDPSSPLSIRASQTALLLLDYHNMSVSRVTNGPDTVSAAASMRDWALKKGMLVLHCLVDLEGKPQPQFKAAARFEQLFDLVKKDPSIGDEHSGLKFEKGSQPVSSRRDADSVGMEKELVFERKAGTLSALESSGLIEFLKKGFESPIREQSRHEEADMGIRSLIMGGLSTSACVLSTAKAAADQGYITTVLSDLCADPEEEVHKVVLEKILVGNCHICSSGEFQKEWDKPTSGDVGFEEKKEEEG